CERERDSPGADAELEGRAVPGSVGEKRDGGLHDVGVAPAADGLVIAIRDVLAEVIDELRHGLRLRPPAAPGTAVGPAEEGERRPQQDLQVDLRRAMLDVPDVELDPLRPRKLRTAVHLGPAGEPRAEVETVALVLVVLLDLVAERGPRADHAHVSAQDVPQLRELVDRRAAEDAADARDPPVAPVDRISRTHALRAHDHRPELEDVEVDAVPTDARLPVENGSTGILELR